MCVRARAHVHFWVLARAALICVSVPSPIPHRPGLWKNGTADLCGSGIKRTHVRTWGGREVECATNQEIRTDAHTTRRKTDSWRGVQLSAQEAPRRTGWWARPRERSSVLSKALEGRDGGRGLGGGPTGRVCVCMWLIHSAVQQKHSIIKQPNSNLKKHHTVLTPVVSWVKMDIVTFLTLFFCAKFASAIPAPLLFT